MIPLAPALVVAAATAFAGSASEHEDRCVHMLMGDDSWPLLDEWATAFVHYVGYWSLYDSAVQFSSWPFPITASRDAIAAMAHSRAVLEKLAHPGDIFLASSVPAGQLNQIGIIATVDGAFPTARGEDWVLECTTIEGMLRASGPKQSRHAVRRVRRFNTHVGDRFVRWADLDRT
jgi:hypothetical protein